MSMRRNSIKQKIVLDKPKTLWDTDPNETSNSNYDGQKTPQRKGTKHMDVIEIIATYPRKNDEVSVWAVENANGRTTIDQMDAFRDTELKKVFCLHPLTDPERAHIIAEGWRLVLSTAAGESLIREARAQGF